MLAGIYKLTFNGTHKIYIGQSCNLLRRKNDYIRDYANGTAHSIKLSNAFKEYGEPTFHVLEVCNLDELDLKESIYISQYNSVDNGFNTLYSAFSTFAEASKSSPTNAHNKYSKETYYKILECLTDKSKTYQNISSTLGVSYSVVHNIAVGNTGHWLAEDLPEMYKRVISMKGSRLTYTNEIEVIHETGLYNTITSARDFARKIGAGSHAGISNLVSGKTFCSHGWILVSMYLKIHTMLNSTKYYRKIAADIKFPRVYKIIEAIDKKEKFNVISI